MTEQREYDPVTGDHLKDWGHPPGPRYPDLLARANAMRAEGFGLVRIRAELEPEIPPAPVTRDLRAPGEVPFHFNIEASHPDEEANIAKVRETMTELMRVPTIEAGAIMPDACPAGPVGTIPVGGVAAARNAIHPGMHSADICCSVMITDLGSADPKTVLDAAQSVTHFGPGGRPQGDRWSAPKDIAAAMRENPFTNGTKTTRMVDEHFGTQGDGNHFLYVGRSRATGRTAMVTHHGSRGPGAMVYKAGMAVAERHRAEISPDTARQNAWIPADTEDGREYWAALQLIRAWTKANHEAIHDRAAAAAGAEVGDRFWNEHNFVFERGGLYYHGKGATPAWREFAADATGLTLIPLNMAEPVLVVRGKDAETGLGFSPHGAGRNYSRSEHRRRMGKLTPDQALDAETAGIDVRFHAGTVDASELPSSYKNADAVVAQIKSYGLADVVDYIDPYGCIMAGDIPPFWQKKKR
ncbi:MAG: RtcB family protein [Paracoccaceae bacterium]|nr:RtcB family protein [Paracoccaceae bacterium]